MADKFNESFSLVYSLTKICPMFHYAIGPTTFPYSGKELSDVHITEEIITKILENSEPIKRREPTIFFPGYLRASLQQLLHQLPSSLSSGGARTARQPGHFQVSRVVS